MFEPPREAAPDTHAKFQQSAAPPPTDYSAHARAPPKASPTPRVSGFADRARCTFERDRSTSPPTAATNPASVAATRQNKCARTQVPKLRASPALSARNFSVAKMAKAP